MRVAFEKHDILADVRGGAHPLLGVAKLQCHRLVDIRAAVDRFALAGDRLLDRHHMRQLRELDIDQFQRLIGNPLVGGRDRGDRIADVADFLAGERFLILADRQNAELDRQVVTGEHPEHTRQRPSPGGVDAQDSGVRVRAAQDAAEEHPRQREVVGKLGLPADLGVSVGLGQRLADDGELLSHGASVSTPPVRRPRRS
jgi:hypothetical protein